VLQGDDEAVEVDLGDDATRRDDSRAATGRVDREAWIRLEPDPALLVEGGPAAQRELRRPGRPVCANHRDP
jgi:hypothetical protein